MPAGQKPSQSLPAVGQSQLTADQLEILVRSYSPSSVAILGCAGENGFERLVDTRVSRVVGVDINPRYIEEARQRYAGRVSMRRHMSYWVGARSC